MQTKFMDYSTTSVENSLFSIKKLRWFLADMKDNDPDIKIKLRLKRDGWQSRFYTISHVSDSSVVILDDNHNQLKFIGFSDILQFTINKNFKNMQAHRHFDILMEI
jgi:hypothetical protein